jgi:hypothetical protein
MLAFRRLKNLEKKLLFLYAVIKNETRFAQCDDQRPSNNAKT